MLKLILSLFAVCISFSSTPTMAQVQAAGCGQMREVFSSADVDPSQLSRSLNRFYECALPAFRDLPRFDPCNPMPGRLCTIINLKRIGVGAPDSGLSCSDAADTVGKSARGQEVRPDELAHASTRHFDCRTRTWNTNHPQNTYSGVAALDPRQQRVFFEAIDMHSAEQIRDACKVVVTLGTSGDFLGDPTNASIAGAAGNYSCNAYFDAAVNNNPLLVIAPNLIPGIKMTQDVWKAVPQFIHVVQSKGNVNVGGHNIPIVVLGPVAGPVVAVACGIFNC
jgi:hypothetical protein